MNMNKLTALLLTATLSLASGARWPPIAARNRTTVRPIPPLMPDRLRPMPVKTWRQIMSITTKLTPAAPCFILMVRR